MDSLVSQKKVQFLDRRGIEIRVDLSSFYGVFANIQRREFERVLSNLIDNAVDAIPVGGVIQITLNAQDQNVLIRVADDGKGIPPKILSRLGRMGETYGKISGSGLGLYHAKTTVESWGGTFSIQSSVGRGTEVSLSLSRARAPGWFTEQMALQPRMVVVILDDEPAIHQIWKERFVRFQTLDSNLTLLHFRTTGEVLKWFRETLGSDDPTIYLFDYELAGESMTGLDLIRMLGVAKQSVLVTHHAEEASLRTRCEKLGVRLLPKNLAAWVPIIQD